MEQPKERKPAWFRTTDRCRFSNLSVTHPEVLLSITPDNDYQLEIAKLGDRILLLKASGFVTSAQLTETLRYSDEHTTDYLDVAVKDDGAGFDAKALSDDAGFHDGFGLFDIREKMSHLGGTVGIDSSPGGGATILMKVPLNK